MEHRNLHFATRLDAVASGLLLFLLVAVRVQAVAATDYAERVSLRLDKTSYCLGDTLRFSATVENADGSAAAVRSRVLYVELLAPEGYAVETRKLKIDGGRCSGTIALRPSLLSGLFEIRAFTRLMVETDAANYFTQAVPVFERQGNGLRMYDRKRKVGEDGGGQSGAAVGKWFSPEPRPFTAEEEALAAKSGATLIAPILPKKHAGVVGITHSAIHTTVADEMEYAIAHGVGMREAPRVFAGETLRLTVSMLRRWGYPAEEPNKLRIVSVKGTYPGDGEVPECLRLYDGPEFDYTDYDSIVIRTDSAICNAFGYDERPPYYHMDGFRSTSMFSTTRNPSGKPSIIICLLPRQKGAQMSLTLGMLKPTTVICLVEKNGKEKLMAAPVTETDHAYSHMEGFAADATPAAPDYSGGQPSADNRRLLYWNPDLTLDANGEATVEFYNNSSCRQIVVSVEGVTADGRPAVYKRDGTR